MGLEIDTGKVPGTEVRRREAERPAFIGLLILGLTGVIFLFFVLTMSVVYENGEDGIQLRTLSAAQHDPEIPEFTINIYFQQISFFKNEQTIVSFWLACLFFCLFEIILLYQRYYMDHVTIVKKRFRKWEDEGVQLRA